MMPCCSVLMMAGVEIALKVLGTPLAQAGLCESIIEAQALGQGHRQHGGRNSTMDNEVAICRTRQRHP